MLVFFGAYIAMLSDIPTAYLAALFANKCSHCAAFIIGFLTVLLLVCTVYWYS